MEKLVHFEKLVSVKVREGFREGFREGKSHMLNSRGP